MAENDKQESVWISIMKTLMKPGYLYGIGEDGELYQVKIDRLPKEGDCIYEMEL